MLPEGDPDGALKTGVLVMIDPVVPTVEIGAGPAGL
jgi:hypothetical protein